MKLRIYIVDDEGPARRGLVEMVQASPLPVELVGQAATVEEAVVGIMDTSPDLLLLDIHLGKGNGFDLLDRLGDAAPRVVFITAHDQYALRAFRLAAVDYLLKPITSSLLHGTLQRALELTAKGHERIALAVLRNNRVRPTEPRIAVPTSDGLHLFDPRNVVRCESEGNYTTLFENSGKKLVCARTLKDFDELLTPYGFVRAHASHLVNLLAVKRYSGRDGGFLELKDGTRIPVAQRKRQQVLDALNALGA
jgi:two-component system LytT family response regulator